MGGDGKSPQLLPISNPACKRLCRTVRIWASARIVGGGDGMEAALDDGIGCPAGLEGEGGKCIDVYV